MPSALVHGPVLASVGEANLGPVMIARPDPKTRFSSLVIGPSASCESVKEMKARQNSKIKKIRELLRSAGLLHLDDQADALGLCRSTTWTILQGNHKASGLSSALINRMLSAPQLPESVRAHIIEYVEEKSAGLYGHNEKRLRKFRALTRGQQRPMRYLGS
jgi:hypothetical protein